MSGNRPDYSAAQTRQTQRSIQAIQAKGQKIEPAQTIQAWPVPATSNFPPAATGGTRPGHMWLEKGNQNAGFQHMQTPNKIASFSGSGIPPADQPRRLPELVQAHTSVGRHIGDQGKGHGRPVMATYIDGRVHRDAVTVGSNGFVVGMNPVSSNAKFRGGQGEVQERTMRDLYNFPPNQIDRRNTGSKDSDSRDANGLSSLSRYATK